jgi:uncharacterized protein YbcI
MEKSSVLTPEQLEQNISQRLIVLYQTKLEHQLNHVSCKLVDKTITIVAEDSITGLERFLLKNNQYELAKEIRLTLHKVLEPHLKFLFEEVVNVPVVDVICDSVFQTGRTSIVAVLAAIPDLGSD